MVPKKFQGYLPYYQVSAATRNFAGWPVLSVEAVESREKGRASQALLSSLTRLHISLIHKLITRSCIELTNPIRQPNENLPRGASLLGTCALSTWTLLCLRSSREVGFRDLRVSALTLGQSRRGIWFEVFRFRCSGFMAYGFSTLTLAHSRQGST